MYDLSSSWKLNNCLSDSEVSHRSYFPNQFISERPSWVKNLEVLISWAKYCLSWKSFICGWRFRAKVLGQERKALRVRPSLKYYEVADFLWCDAISFCKFPLLPPLLLQEKERHAIFFLAEVPDRGHAIGKPGHLERYTMLFWTSSWRCWSVWKTAAQIQPLLCSCFLVQVLVPLSFATYFSC